jgi:deoxyribonucleoside regulator
MCGQFFDTQGKIMDVELNQRSIGIGLSTLQNIDPVVAVAGGEAKAEAILGALRGRFLNVLITDDAAALKVLEMES